MIDTFLFDFDGTVVNSVPGIMATLEKTKVAMDIDFDLDYAKSLIGTPLVSMGVELCGNARAAEFVEVYRREYFKYGADKIYYFEGMKELLETLTSKGLTCAVVTSKRRDSLDANLEFLDGHKYFDLLVSKESTDFFKPHPAPAEYALTGLNVEPKQAVMIGDTLFDKEAADNCGMAFVGCRYGYDKENMAKVCKDNLAQTGYDLYQLITDAI